MDAVKKKGVRRPMNAFLIFCKRHRSKEREKNLELDNRSVTRILGDKWAKLEPEKKAFYTNLAKECKDAFMRANPDYKWHSADKSQGSSKSAAARVPATAPSRKSVPQATAPSRKSVSQATASSRKSVPQAAAPSRKSVPRATAPSRKPLPQATAPSRKSVPRDTAPSRNPLPEASAHSRNPLSQAMAPSRNPLSQALAPSRNPLPEMSMDTLASPSKSSGKATSPSISESSKLVDGGPTPAADKTSALLQLAQMCSTELLGTGRAKATSVTSPTLQSSPLPPPKKRARQWSLDNSEGPLSPDAQKSDSQSRKSSKPTSGNKKQEAASSNKKSRNASRNSQSAIQSPSLKLDKKQNDSLPNQQFSPPSHPMSEVRSFPPFCKTQTSGVVHSIALRGDDQEMPRQCPDQSLSHPGSITPFFYRETLGSASETVPPSAHRTSRDMSEQVLDFSHHAAKQVETGKPDSLFERKYDSIGLSLPTEGKIASLLSSSHPLAGYEAGFVKADIDRKTPASANFTPSPQPLTNDKLGPTDLKLCSGSLVSDANFSSNVSQSFTEGKVKKKWTQRMLVEAKKEEDEARQVTCNAERSWPQTSVPLSLKTSDLQAPLTDFSSDRSPFFIAKSEMKSEPPPVFSDGLISKSSLPKDYTFHSINAGNSSSPFKDAKPEALQSNTLYRALMGQTPSPFTMSSYAKTSTTTPAPNNFSSSSFGSFSPKVEEDKKIFTPIAACGKKIMDHIVERLFQTGFSGEMKNAEAVHKVQAEQTPPHFSDDSSVCLKPPPPVKNSIVDLQTAFSFPVRSAQNLVEKIVTEMCQAPPNQEISYNDDINYIKQEVETSVGQGDYGSAVKYPDKACPDVKNVGKDKSSEGSCPTTLSSEQTGLPSEVADDSNSDSTFPAVRKSRRANRGQKYQALIKEGIIQPSKERLAARNAERNVRSCSSRDDLEKSEPKKILKRLYSEREPPQASTNSDTQVPKSDETSESSKEFNLEKEIASLPTCSFEQFEKKKTLQNRRHSEAMLRKSDSKGGQSQLPKASASSNGLKKEVSVKNGRAATTSYHAVSLKELGCHTVHIPLIKEERPYEGLTGSKKRKARRHGITRISVAPIHEDAKENSEKPTGPKVVCKVNVSDRVFSSDKTSYQNTSVGKKGRNPVFINSKAPCGEEDSLTFKMTPLSSQLNDGHAGKSPQLAQHNFPALTLLSSVMIDSEKAISPACQSRAPPTTQSPMPAALAKPWPLNGVETSPIAAKSASRQLTPVSHVPFSAASVHSETTQLAKWMAAFPACLQMPSALEKASSSVPVSSVASNGKPFPHAWPTPVMSAPAVSVTSATSPVNALHAIPVMTPVPMQSNSSVPMPNSVNGTLGSNTMQRPAISSVLSPYVISTLTASKTTESTSSSWPKPVHTEKQPAPRRKKAPKSATDEKHKPNLDLLSSMGSKSLEPGTKKLVKLLLKGDGDDEASVRSSMDVNGQTQPIEPKQSVAKPVQPRNRQASKTGKGGGRKGGQQNVQQSSCSSPQYLSLKTQLKAGQILASNQFADPSAKKHKPTIWDHLNSPGCLPIKSTKAPQNSVPPFKKRIQESSPPPQSSVPSDALPKGQRVVTGTPKSSNRDSVGSDTESASEETEGHVSSDTDSAEESEIGATCPTAVKTNAPTTTVISSCSNVSSPTTSCNLDDVQPSSLQMRNVIMPKLSSDVQRFVSSGPFILTAPSVHLATRTGDTTTAASSAQPAVVSAVNSLSTQPISRSSSPAVYLPVIVPATDNRQTKEDVSKTLFTPVSSVPVNTPPPVPRIPIIPACPPTSTGIDPGKCDARASSSFLDGSSAQVSASPHLPGSPSVAAVQS